MHSLCIEIIVFQYDERIDLFLFIYFSCRKDSSDVFEVNAYLELIKILVKHERLDGKQCMLSFNVYYCYIIQISFHQNKNINGISCPTKCLNILHPNLHVNSTRDTWTM